MRVHFSKRALVYFLLVDAVLIFSALWLFSSRHRDVAPIGFESFAIGEMRLRSSAFDQNGPMPLRFACAREGGTNISPPLSISGVPAEAKSLVLAVEDPDASFGRWTHWTMWNLSPRLTEIKEGTVPGGAVQGPNSSGERAYDGPCPPQGTHRYLFKLYALDTVLQVPPNTDPQSLRQMIAGHVLGQTALLGTFRKQ